MTILLEKRRYVTLERFPSAVHRPDSPAVAIQEQQGGQDLLIDKSAE